MCIRDSYNDGTDTHTPNNSLTCSISGWKVIRVDHPGDRIFNGSLKVETTSSLMGPVGIGTTSPSSLLNVHKDALSPAVIELSNTVTSGDNNIIVAQIKANTVSEELTRIETRNSADSHDDGNLVFYNRDGYTNTFAESMRITGKGKVGIGTSSPSQELHVNGGVHIDGNITTPTAGTKGLLLDYYEGKSRYWSRGVDDQTRGSHYFYISDTDESEASNQQLTAMVISSSGNVGIGTTSPKAAKLVIREDSNYGLRLEDAAGHYFRVNTGGDTEIRGNISASALRVENDAQIQGDLGIGGTIFGLSGFGVTIDDVAVTDGSTNFGSGSNPAISIHSRTGSMSITGSTFTFNGENVLTDSDVYWYNTGTELTASNNVGISGSLQVLGDITASSLSIRPKNVTLINFEYSSSQADDEESFNFFPTLTFGGANAHIGRSDNLSSFGTPSNGIKFDTSNIVHLGNIGNDAKSSITIQDAEVTVPKIAYISPFHIFQHDVGTNIVSFTESRVYLYGDTHITGSLYVSESVTARSFTGSLFGTASYATTASFVVSSSYATTASYVASSSYAMTASYAVSSSYATTASFASFAVSSSYATTASYALNSDNEGFPFTGSAGISGSLTITNQNAAQLILRGDSGDVGDTGQVDGIIDCLLYTSPSPRD